MGTIGWAYLLRVTFKLSRLKWVAKIISIYFSPPANITRGNNFYYSINIGEKMEALNLLTVYQFVEKYPAFKIGGVRAYIFNEKKNRLAESGAVLRVGRKVLINEPRFFYWVQSQNQAA